MKPGRSWVWSDQEHPNAYCYLRRRFETGDAVMQAELRITADTNYMVWLNGRYVGQGPGPFVGEVRPLDRYGVTELLHEGENAVCILGNWWGVTSHSRPRGRAGVLAELAWETAGGERHAVGTDDSWRALLSDAWERDVPRRSGALGWTEYYDARREPVGWTAPGFDDADWPSATPVDVGERVLFPRLTALLREWAVDPVGLTGAWLAEPEAPGPADETDLTEFLDTEPLQPLDESRRSALAEALVAPGPVTIDSLPRDRGLALTLDMGREIVGHLELDVEAGAGTRIDLAPAELLRGDRPWCRRKGCSYAQRYLTREGRQRWRTYAWHGLRYLHVVLRQAPEPLTINRLGVWRREADLDWRARFSCSDERLQRIWDIGRHTLRVGTQEVQVDCPTREQAAYWGDAGWIGLWTLWMTGDAGHLKHLLLSAEPSQYEDGQLPASIFSSLGQILFDYSLVMPWALWEYWWHTGDLSVPRRLSDTVERMLNWYRDRCGESGLVEFDAVAAHERREGTLFIDHPGLGWHNFPHPGLDRRGTSAGLNLFLLRALQCRAKVLDAQGETARAAETQGEAARLFGAIERTFFDAGRCAYADALVDGALSPQTSQQVNALAVLTGVCPPERRRRVLDRVLSDDPELCRCSPYFWLYQIEAMGMAGMHAEMLEAIRTLWGTMADAGATTWWETFAGDELDSLCHPWSSAPNHALQRHMLGVRCAAPGFARVELRPRPDLLERARGTVCTPLGQIAVGWEPTPGGARLTAELPRGACGTVFAPSGWTLDGERSRQIAEGAGMRVLARPVSPVV